MLPAKSQDSADMPLRMTFRRDVLSVLHPKLQGYMVPECHFHKHVCTFLTLLAGVG